MAMVGLLRELGITTIAEMVEDEKHLEVIKECGFRFSQGYLVGRSSVDIGAFGGPPPVV
jgi:EAL domain-containing protein (putative c-di-GMP-specific phosphodiesterase class I)